MDPPVVPADRTDGWRRVAETTERPFEAGPVSVAAGTVRYDRERPPPQPFFFASHLRITPRTRPNPALTRLVESRARAGFRDRLADRDIRAVEHVEDGRLTVDDPTASEARRSTFRGRCVVDGEPVPVEALLAVWVSEASETYLLAGGAYPADDDREAARDDILALIRGVRAPGDDAEDDGRDDRRE